MASTAEASVVGGAIRDVTAGTYNTLGSPLRQDGEIAACASGCFNSHSG